MCVTPSYRGIFFYIYGECLCGIYVHYHARPGLVYSGGAGYGNPGVYSQRAISGASAISNIAIHISGDNHIGVVAASNGGVCRANLGKAKFRGKDKG